MGLSLGGAASQTSSNATASSTQANTYAPSQTALQGELGSDLSTNLKAAQGGVLTPGTTAELTSANDATNKTASGLTSRINQFLAARGFGKSGQTGQATLQGELGRESQIGTNTANAYASQNNLNTSNLLAALNYAFTSLGSSATGTSSGSSSGTAEGGGLKFQLPGVQTILNGVGT